MGLGVAERRAVRLVEFNLHVARYAHPSWLEPTFGGKLPARVEPHVSAWLLQQTGLHTSMDWEMQEAQKTLWLLDRPAVERLASELALAMHREWLMQIIDSTRLRALRDSVGAEALSFVVDEVPGGCFHYQSPVVSFSCDSPRDVRTELQEHGARTLVALLHPSCIAVRGRAQLFFERARTLATVPALEPTLADRALELICGRLIPRRFPDWAWCF